MAHGLRFRFFFKRNCYLIGSENVKNSQLIMIVKFKHILFAELKQNELDTNKSYLCSLLHIIMII